MLLNGVTRTLLARYSDGSREMNGFILVAYTSRTHMSRFSAHGPSHFAPISMAPKRSPGWRSNTPPMVIAVRKLQIAKDIVANENGSEPSSWLSTLPGLNAGARPHSGDLMKPGSPPTCTSTAMLREE